MNHTFTIRSFVPKSFLITAALTLGVAGFVGLVDAQVKKGKSRPLTTGQLMKGTIKPHCEGIKKGLDANPADDKAWAEIALHAAILNEATYTLMDDGRCPDGVWADATTKAMRDGSADVLKAVEAKDVAAGKAAFGAMTRSCKACHDKHKEKDKK
ncbi:MAG TPA: hypothetical protein DCM86_16140 [Verrucomicrobiales bacterium]|nr:hypothetical protein [Verrucomicrobiales bacterium]